MERSINLLSEIVTAYDAGDYDKVSRKSHEFELSLNAEYGSKDSPEQCWIDNIRQTFVMSSTGFPVEQSAIDQARRYYERVKDIW